MVSESVCVGEREREGKGLRDISAEECDVLEVM